MKKDHKIEIRVTKELKEEFKQKAEDSGLTLSSFLIKCGQNKKIKVRRSLKEDKIIYHLSKIGTNLNQLTHLSNIGNFEKMEVKETLEELNKILKSML